MRLLQSMIFYSMGFIILVTMFYPLFSDEHDIYYILFLFISIFGLIGLNIGIFFIDKYQKSELNEGEEKQ